MPTSDDSPLWQSITDWTAEIPNWHVVQTTVTIPDEWFVNNCVGRYQQILYTYHFEDYRDYNLFKLTWI